VRILVLGGTKFLGIAVVEAALAAGHEVTLANRGVTNPRLFTEQERIRVDLAGELGVLAGRTWDGVVDLDPTQLTRHTRRRAEALREAVGRYVFVSSVSVYSDFSGPLDESSPLYEPPDPEPEEFAEELYGGLKAGSEHALLDVFGTRATVARAGLIIGPRDPTDRFTYWPRRLAEGGDVLAPGDPDAAVQLVDARDLGAWLVRLVEDGVGGVFNATGPAEPLTLGRALERIAAAVGSSSRLVWVDDRPILDAGVKPWMELPLWLPDDPRYAHFMRADISRALAAGLAFRPLEETAQETLAWSREAGVQRPTLSRERESEILAAVRASS
jgi:nucleoside-diphosphate-sugar epimerase